MTKVEVTIREKEESNRWIRMSMEEYIKFIKEQSKLLNIKEEVKPFMRMPVKAGTALLNEIFTPVGVDLKVNPKTVAYYMRGGIKKG